MVLVGSFIMGAAESSNRRDLSVIVAGTLPWPELQPCIDSFYAQATAIGAEIIVATRPGGLPDDLYPGIVRVVEANGTLYSLRAASLTQATGEVIALTEDHCRVRPDWCESVLEAHRRHPDAAAIIGCVENTARARLSEWASYIVGNGTFMHPLRGGAYTGAVTSANSSFKRSAIPASMPAFGWSGDWYAQWLGERDGLVTLDDTAVVDHHLEISLTEAVKTFYRDARGSAALRRDTTAGPAIVQAVRETLLAPVSALRSGLRIAVRKGQFRSEAMLSVPAMTALLVAYQIGTLLGRIHGVGTASERLY